MNPSYNAYLNAGSSVNPCLGCQSAGCVYCEFYTDRRDWSEEPTKPYRKKYYRLSGYKRTTREDRFRPNAPAAVAGF